MQKTKIFDKVPFRINMRTRSDSTVCVVAKFCTGIPMKRELITMKIDEYIYNTIYTSYHVILWYF